LVKSFSFLASAPQFIHKRGHGSANKAATLLDRAVELTYIGGQYGNQKPSPFLCMVFKLLQLMPEREIVLEYLHDTGYKYLRALAALYTRLTWSALDIFKTLEPLLGRL
ncbi:PRP38 family-domain-containing protein, partial [Terfezia claveryi]